MSKAIKAVAGIAVAYVGVITGQAWLTNIGLGITASAISQAIAKKPKRPRPQYDVSYAGTVEPRAIIYGQIKVSGMQTIPPWTSGDGNKYLHEVQSLAGHECEDITDAYFNQDVIADANIGAVSGTVDDGKVSSGTYANKAWIRRYLGTSGQTVDFILDTAFSAWTSNHRGRLVTNVAVQYELDDAVYKTGKPQSSFIVKGKKCYDPRLDSSPGAAPTNPSFIAYTVNPALCLADYLIDTNIGCKIPTAEIDWDLVVAAANECDENVSVPNPPTTQDRYTCNVRIFVASTDAERRENIATLVQAMMGRCYWRGGKYRMYAGAAESSSFDLTDNDLVGRISMPTEISLNNKYNFVPGQFIDAARNYQRLEFEPRSNSGYESTDGGRKPREVDFDACTNQYEAQRNAIVILKRSRRKKEITGIWGMSAFRIRAGDVGTITLAEWGLSSQLVRCQSWKFLPDYTIEATFLEELASDWDDPSSPGDYTVPSTTAGPGSGDFVPGAPQDFAATPIVDGILFQWDPPANAPPGTRYTIYEYTSATPFASATVVAQQLTGTSRTIIKSDTTTRYYWIVARAHFSGTDSSPTPSGDGIAGHALSVSTGFRATISSSTKFKLLVGVSSGNTTTVTVTPINGTAPYTYSWARLSGDTTLTAIASTSATTGFNNTGMVDQEVNAATFRCTVTDNLSATCTVDCNVTFFRDDSP